MSASRRPTAAITARLTDQAHRSVDDPVALAKAARIVRAALARERITLAELTPLPPRERDARPAAPEGASAA